MNSNFPKTESLFSNNLYIDQISLSKGIDLIIEQQRQAADAVKNSRATIRRAINKIYEHLTSSAKGRLIYVGAGTSGRVGLQDGVELYPTFNWPKSRLDFIIAGGEKAVFQPIENAEDDIKTAEQIIKRKNINFKDVVIGLAASGNTPFTCKIMEQASKKDSLTIAISNNPKGEILKFGKIQIILNTKEEVIAGSTRLKAATAQKICLNTISSMLMTKMGKVKKGVMIDMVPTNKKLRQRKKLIASILNR